MSEVKFTEGKWYVSNGIFVGAKGVDDYVVSGVSNLDDAKANANLIAAAPEMYGELINEVDFLIELLNKLIPGSSIADEVSGRIKTIEDVLAKARGEQ